jgi:hypothetical protein
MHGAKTPFGRPHDRVQVALGQQLFRDAGLDAFAEQRAIP